MATTKLAIGDMAPDFALPGDPDLDKLSGFTTYDAAVLEFDFVPTANQVVFNYVFASDEYYKPCISGRTRSGATSASPTRSPSRG